MFRLDSRNDSNIDRWLLRKMSKFKHQCEVANNALKELINMDTKTPIQNPKIINIIQTEIQTHSFIPLQTDDTYKNDVYTDDTYEKFLMHEENTHKNSNHLNDTYQCRIEPNGSDESFNCLMENDVFAESNDELPLVLLKSKKKKSKRKKQNGIPLPNELINQDSNTNQTENQNSIKKRMKKPRDGFSSRMVQETDEYIVIKLTKEQVIKEMEDRSKTDSYIRSPFKCQKCVKGFNFEDVLQTHLEKHSMKNGTFPCDMCEQYCPSAVSLRGHIKSHTTRYKCKLCGHIRLSRQHLLEHHAISHTNAATSYKCDYCQFTTNKRTVMQRHVRRHASGESHACHKCGKLFKSIESLRLHTVRHDKSSRFHCTRCDASFVYPSLLRRHEQCVHERRDYYCVECDVQFNSAESLRLHFKKAKRHRDSSAYKHVCPQCPQRFFTRASLGVHLSSVHDAPKTHPCVYCARLYSSRDALRAHIWRAHGKDKRHDRQDSSKSEACCGAAQKAIQDVQTNHKKEDILQYENKVEE